MGNNLSHRNQSWFEDYTVTSNKQDKEFFQLVSKKQNNSKKYIGRKLQVSSTPIYQDVEELVQYKVSQPTPFVTPILKQYKQQAQQYCSNDVHHYLLFDKPLLNLQQSIQQRRSRGQLYTNEDISLVIYNISHGLNYQAKINDLQSYLIPQQIFITQTDVQLSDSFLQVNEMYPANCNHILPMLPSAQKLNSFHDAFCIYDQLSSNLFSLGLIALQMYDLNQDVLKIYQKVRNRHTRINWSLLEQKTDQIKDNGIRKKIKTLTSSHQQHRKQIFFLLQQGKPKNNLTLQIGGQNIPKNRKQFQINQKYQPDKYVNEQYKYPSSNNISLPNVYQNNLPIQRYQYQSQNKYAQSAIQPINYQRTNPQVQFHSTRQPSNSSILNFNNNQQTNNFIDYNNPNINFKKPTEINNTFNNNLNYNNTRIINNSQVRLQNFRNNEIKLYPNNNNNQQKLYIKDIKPEINTLLRQNQNYYEDTKFNYQPTNQINPKKYQEQRQNNINKFQQKTILNYTSKFDQKQINTNTSNFNNYSSYNNNPSSYRNDETQYNKKNYDNNIESYKNPKTQNKIKSYYQSTDFENKNLYTSSELLNKLKEDKIDTIHEAFQPSFKDIQFIKKEIKKLDNTAMDQKKKEIINDSPDKGLNSSNTNKFNNENYYQQINHFQEDKKNKQYIQYQEAAENKPQQLYANTINEGQRESEEDLEGEYVIEEYNIGSRYEGYKINGMRNGPGKFYYQDGSFYDGDWKDNKMHGYGKLFDSNGNLAYQGDWFMDQFHGDGKVYNSNPTMLDDSFDCKNFNNLQEQWVYYEGKLKMDVKEGHGKILLENGQIFQGEFHDDRINGQGFFHNLKGQIIHGFWKDSVLVQQL